MRLWSPDGWQHVPGALAVCLIRRLEIKVQRDDVAPQQAEDRTHRPGGVDDGGGWCVMVVAGGGRGVMTLVGGGGGGACW